MKRATVRFYTEDGKYMGWQWLNTTTFRELRNWVRSFNAFKIHKHTYSLINWGSFILSPYSKMVK